MENYFDNNEKNGVYTGLASLCASLVAGLACIGPLLGIALGVSGLGWLSQFSYLTLPASVVSLALLTVAIVMYVKRKSSCANRRRHYLNLFFLAITTLVVIGINVFEFIILPRLS